MATLVAIDPKTRFADGAEFESANVGEMLEYARRAGYSHVRSWDGKAWHAIDAILPGVDWLEGHTAQRMGCQVSMPWRCTWVDGPDRVRAYPLREWALHVGPVELCNDVYMASLGLM